jgi:hypothetical protein
LIVQPKQYVVLANSGKASLNGGLPKVDYVFSNRKMVLSRRDQLTLLNPNGRRIDRVNWAARGFPRIPGVSMALRSVSLDNDVGIHWCLSKARYGLGDRGTPGRANDCGGAPAKPPVAKTRRTPRPIQPPLVPSPVEPPVTQVEIQPVRQSKSPMVAPVTPVVRPTMASPVALPMAPVAPAVPVLAPLRATIGDSSSRLSHCPHTSPQETH